jgi:hypothetical protein
MHRIRDYIHVFVDSGIPPILAYRQSTDGGHAVAVVGHDIVERPDELNADWNAFLGTFRNSYFVDTFYVMDDARGPYVPFYFEKDSDPAVPCMSNCDHISVIAPVFCEVAIDYHFQRNQGSILDEFIRMSDDWNQWIADLREDSELKGKGAVKDWDDYLLQSTVEDPIVARPALLDSRRWKIQLLRGDVPPRIREIYQALLLPKYIWVAEIAKFSDVNKGSRSQRRILGEVIFDATANPHSPLDSLIAAHVRGLLMLRRPDGEIQIHLPNLDFSPYRPLRRSI